MLRLIHRVHATRTLPKLDPQPSEHTVKAPWQQPPKTQKRSRMKGTPPMGKGLHPLSMSTRNTSVYTNTRKLFAVFSEGPFSSEVT